MTRVAPITALLIALSAGSAFADVTWYVTTSATANRLTPIDTKPASVRLADGRVCAVGAVGDFGGRQVVCVRGKEKVQFSVQCDTTRPRDHVQLRFTSPKGTQIDFIEVGCELSGG